MAKRRACKACKDELPEGSHPSRRYCDDDCKAGRPKAAPPLPTPVLDALNAAVAQAAHLGDDDQPAIEAARALARKIDLADEYLVALARQAEESERRPPAPDNVSLPTFLKYCESLRLTPAGRKGLVEKKPEAKGGKLGRLSPVPKPA